MNADTIARRYQFDRDRWIAAAERLRAPYWDWAANPIPPDELIAMPQVAIIGFDGRTRWVNNPLMGYYFHPIDGRFTGTLSGAFKTVRHPDQNGQEGPDSVLRLRG
jgi:tyrosinase